MENNSGDKDRALSPPEVTAKAAILRECDKLAKAGVTFVAVHFDGYGDDGATEDVNCFDSEWYAYAEHEPVEYDASHLQDHFETLVPFGYENDCGGFGDVILDVAARKVTVERNRQVQATFVTQPTVSASKGAVALSSTTQLEIEFDSVEFNYPRQRALLQIPSLRVMAGEHVAMARPNGAGKSTLTKLIVRLYDPTSGTIRIKSFSTATLILKSSTFPVPITSSA